MNPATQTSQSTIIVRSYDGRECSGNRLDDLIFDNQNVDFWNRLHFPSNVHSLQMGQQCYNLDSKTFHPAKPAKLTNFDEKPLINSKTGNFHIAEIDMQLLQHTPFHPTEVKLRATNLKRKYGHYKIHDLYVKQNDGYKCDSIGDVYQIDSKRKTENSKFTKIHSNYKIGEISSRHDHFNDLDEAEGEYIDLNLPLLGKNSVVGRSLAFYHKDTAEKIVCYNITTGDPVRVYTAKLLDADHNVTFTFQQSAVDEHDFTRVRIESRIYGKVIRTEKTNENNNNETEKIVNFSYKQPKPSFQHKYGVHLFSSNNCAYVGGHFRDVVSPCPNSNYSEGSERCEIGALSQKYKPLNFNGSMQYTDMLLPLQGPLGLAKRSLVVRRENNSPEMFLCGKFELLHSSSTRFETGSMVLMYVLVTVFVMF